MPPLDPIVSLSVALAEAPGTHAFFLGSGVSKDAGVPTGWEVLRATQQRVRQVELASPDSPDPAPVDDEELDAWLVATERDKLTYSELLELAAPDPATRRAYLASFFENVKPGPTHIALADLAARGLVKVFVTTNFDRLLEHALQVRGIEPVVIASDADLETQVPREHASCVIVKPHGDYLQQTIRNTVDELAELDPAMTNELAEIFDRYGLVVLGYSGSDPGIAAILSRRRSRYGLWWVARRTLESHLGEFVRTLGGRVIKRGGASAFLTDLNARLTVFAQHPTGHTPAAVHDQTLELLRSKDTVGLTEHLRREQHAWRTALASAVASSRSQPPDDKEIVRGVWTALFPSLERRLASLLPLATHDSQRLAAELRGLADVLGRSPRQDGYAAWSELPRFATTWVGYMLGAWLLRSEEYGSIRSLLDLTFTDPYGDRERVVSLFGDAQAVVGDAMAPPVDTRWLSPVWMYFTRSLDDSAWLIKRYPDLTEDGEPERLLAQFDLLVAWHFQFAGETAIAHFALEGGRAEQFARNVAGDAALRADVAEATGVDLARFDAEAATALAGVYVFHTRRHLERIQEIVGGAR